MTLGLSATVLAREDEGGMTLFFNITEQDQPDFNLVTGALNYFEHQERTPRDVYLHIARSSLAKSGEQRVLARAKLLRRLDDPFAEQQMRIGQPQLVSRDINTKPQAPVDLQHAPRQLHGESGDQ